MLITGSGSELETADAAADAERESVAPPTCLRHRSPTNPELECQTIAIKLQSGRKNSRLSPLVLNIHCGVKKSSISLYTHARSRARARTRRSV